jgi:hypothetical protein
MFAQEIEPEPLSFLIPSLDNLDFTKKGQQATTESWVVSNLDIIPPDELKKVGLLAADPAMRISRDRLQLSELIHATEPPSHIADRFLIGKSYDYEVYTFTMLRHAKTVMGLRLPTYKDTQNMVQTKTFGGDYSPFPCNLGVNLDFKETPLGDVDRKRIPRRPERYQANGDDPNHGFAVEDEAERRSFVSWLQAGHTLLDFPQKVNLAAKETVESYLRYICSIYRRKIQIDIAAIGAGDERPVQELMMPFCSDGSPIYQLGRLLRELGNEFNDVPVRQYLGGFHVILEILNKRSELFEEFQRTFVKLYRKSEGKQNWVLFPRDPRQAEEEAIPYLAAIWKSAADVVAQMNGRNAASADLVHKHMLHEAAKKPIANAILCDLHLLEIYFLLRDSEKSGCLDWFIAALRLMQPLFATTNAWKYVEICSDLLVWWETASEAEKVLVENFIFTRPTPDGKRLFIDRRQEIFNLLFRDELGHNVLPGHEAKMLGLSMRMQELLETKKVASFVKGSDFTKPSMNFNQSTTQALLLENFVLIYVRLTEMRIWWPNSDIILRGPTNKVVRASNECLQNAQGEPISSESLRFRSIGEARLKDYFVQWIWLNPDVVARPHTYEAGGVDLSRIVSTAQRQSKKLSVIEILATSVSELELIKACKRKRAPLIEHIDLAIATLDNADAFSEEDIAQHALLIERTIPILAAYLVGLRRRCFAQRPDEREELLQNIQHGGTQTSKSSEEERLHHLQNRFFQLDTDVRQQFEDEIQFGSIP